MSETTQPLTGKELRQFGLIFGGMAAGMFGLLLPFIFGRPFPAWPWITAGVMWLWALILPNTLRYPYKGWMKIALALGWINTRFILGLAFYMMVWPMALILRLFDKDPMTRRLDADAVTYRVKSKIPSINHFERPF